jgi:hypothetical protein
VGNDQNPKGQCRLQGQNFSRVGQIFSQIRWKPNFEGECVGRFYKNISNIP